MTSAKPRRETPQRRDLRLSPSGIDERVRQQWQLTFDLTSHGIAVLDGRTGCIKQVNRGFARMHGGLPEDFAGRPIATTLTEEWQARIPEIVETIQDRGSRSFACDRVRRDGSTFPTNTEVVAARSPEGELLYRLVFVTDLTELRTRETAERRAVDRFEQVFQDAPVGMVVVRAGVIERINASAEKILGGRAEDLVGIDHRLVTHLADAPLTVAALAAVQPGIALPREDRRITQPGGAVSHIRYTYSILHEGPGSVGPLVLVLIEDRTAEVNARAVEEQLRLVEDRDQIAHDLHDNAIQHLFAIGMTVQSIAAGLPDSAHARRLEKTLEDIDNTIRGIRGVIQVLRPSAVAF